MRRRSSTRSLKNRIASFSVASQPSSHPNRKFSKAPNRYRRSGHDRSGRLSNRAGSSVGDTSPLGLAIAPHQFEETESVAHRTDVAHFVGIDGRDGNRFDSIALAAGNDEHFSFVIETLHAAKQLRNQLSI